MIGSTRNPTSTDEAHSPRYRRCLYSLTRGVSTATPFHGCTSTVAHLSRPIGVFAALAIATSFRFLCRPTHSTPHATFAARWSRTTRTSEPLVLGADCYHFGLADSHRKHVLRVTGGEIRSRSALYADYSKLAKVRWHSTCLTSISAQYINNIYSARVPMHFLVAHGYETPPCYRRLVAARVFTHAQVPIFIAYVPTSFLE